MYVRESNLANSCRFERENADEIVTIGMGNISMKL